MGGKGRGPYGGDNETTAVVDGFARARSRENIPRYSRFYPGMGRAGCGTLPIVEFPYEKSSFFIRAPI